MKVTTILLDPKTVLGGVIFGFAIGLFARPLGQTLMPIGSLYISFLSMCLLPILITAVVTGIAGLLRAAVSLGNRDSCARAAVSDRRCGCPDQC